MIKIATKKVQFGLFFSLEQRNTKCMDKQNSLKYRQSLKNQVQGFINFFA